jgi:4-amino-4-deoxy-L-arabinose transferase-like glycosyltransferase
MTTTATARPARHPFAQLYDALIDPARCERTMAVLLVVYAVAWTAYGTIAKSSQDLHFDIGEMFAWSHQVGWSSPTHPPLGPWLMRAWFWVMPVEDWSFYLLGIVVATLGLWIAWRLAARYLPPDKRAVGIMLLTFLPFYNFHALKYNASSVLTPFWALTAWWFLLSFETRRADWAALAGLAAAASMLGKYWSLFMLAGLALGAVADPRRAAYFRSPAPWLTMMVGALALAPHLYFIASHGFSTFHFAMTSHVTTLPEAVQWSLYFLASVLGYMAPAIVLNGFVTFPRLAAIRDTLWPANAERRFFIIALVTPFVLAALVAVAVQARLDPLWSMSGMTLLPVVLLSSPLVSVQRAAAIRLTAMAVIFPLVMVAAAPAIAIVLHRYSLQNNYGTHYKLIAQAVSKAWREQTAAPLRIVGGIRPIVDGSNPYFPSRPATFAMAEPARTPWVDDGRIKRDGIAIVCPVSDTGCMQDLSTYAERFGAKMIEDVTLARRYFGTADKPVLYRIAIIPPLSPPRSTD